MPIRPRPRPALRIQAVLLPLLVAACGSSGGGTGDFELLSASVPDNGTWQINRPMHFVFSEDVDFQTVNLNTIQIVQISGTPASGEFSLLDPRTVVFQPRCPTLDNFADAGLVPGGVQYQIKILVSPQGGAVLRSTSGEPLAENQTLTFQTPNSLDPAVLFVDTALGPPSAVIRTDPAQTQASYLELGDDPSNRVYFEPRPTPDADLGAQTPLGFAAGLNLYSDVSSHLAVLVAINQAVIPSDANVNPDTVRMEYLTGAGTWTTVAHTVVLPPNSNCTGTGALLRVTPTGILPQNHFVRVVLTQDFKDLVGDANLVAVTVGSFLVTTATDPDPPFAPGLEGDERLEEFSAGGASPASLEDTSAALDEPRADWGVDGTLAAGFSFSGTGGQGGQFDWKIGNDAPLTPANNPTILLDTSFSVITNDPPSLQQTVLNGVVDVRNLWVTPSGTLKIQGPNACTILVSGSARIEGEIALNGNHNFGVISVQVTNQAEPGAAGNAGGGKGGTGNFLTTTSTPKGENGYGAFGVANGGGGGGESGFNTGWPGDDGDERRRPGGGGGGTFGANSLRPAGIATGYTNPNACPDQAQIGLDAEKGFPGHDVATGVITGLHPPQGGDPGPRPFFDADSTNDFWGTLRKNPGGQVILGELQGPLAGAGGGGGGNAIVSNSFPTDPYDIQGDEKGGGGGGGGGSLTILALGNITFGPQGRINASGGNGGRGEITSLGGFDAIGGGAGGGSGGHIILQTASQIDLSAISTTALPPGGIQARGGVGGAGKNSLGGSTPDVLPPYPNPLDPRHDALPQNSYPSTGSTTPCGVVPGASCPPCPNNNAGYLAGNGVGDGDGPSFSHVVMNAGGDGGPGIIQLHAPALTDIVKPTAATARIFDVIRPPPIGTGPIGGVPQFAVINEPTQWDQLQPIFGRKSQGISKWISLGAASVSPDVATLTSEAVFFSFGGTDTITGAVETTPTAQVEDLAPILPTGVIGTAPTPPYVVTPEFRTVVFDASGSLLTDDIYKRNPALLKRFVIRLETVTQVRRFEVGSATYDGATGLLSLTVADAGPVLQGFTGASVQVIPRFFGVLTEGDADSLPDTGEIVVEFQATTATVQGDPDPSEISAWEKDITLLDPNVDPPPPPAGRNPDYRFIRFRVSFDISATGAPLTVDTPIPALDFFRVPFKF